MNKFRITSGFNKMQNRVCARSIFHEQIDNKGILIFLVVMTALAGLLYLWQVNSLATRGYKTKDLEGRVSDLKDQNKKLELEMTELRSSDRIAGKLKELNLVETARVEYLAVDSPVAINR